MARYGFLASVMTFFVVAVGSMPSSAEDLRVLPAETAKEKSPAGMTARHLTPLLHAALDARLVEYEKLKTAADLAAWQKQRREFFLAQLGPLPERTPLNAKTVASVPKDGYTLEKVIFESQPKHYLTGVMYVPKGEAPTANAANRFPGVIVPCGHSANGKAAEPYQRACILLAKNGIAVFCYDPIGQGERSQILDPAGKPIHGSTTEHTLVGVGSILVGRNTATYRIWDGMRAIDYLVSRPDIDPAKIGCCGNSGGGTLTSYLMALDDRIVCAAPNCYLTTFRRLIDTLGPQDAEQNIFGQVAGGLDHADYILLRAPKPTLMGVATQDFFDIGGSWETYRQAKRFYGRMGYSERVDLCETDAKHGFSVELRVGTVRWMRRWLLQKDDAVTESDFPVAKDAELQCSPEGQVMRIVGARSVLELNADLAASLAEKRKPLWQAAVSDPAAKAALLEQVRKLAGVRPLTQLPRGTSEKAGKVEREGYVIEKLVLRPEAHLELPALWFIPAKPSDEVTLYLHGGGKELDAGPGGPIEKLVQKGQRVLAVDLRGMGETARPASKGDDHVGPEWRDFFLAYLLGKSLVGLEAEDILNSARFAGVGDNPDRPRAVHLIAIGKASVPALHAAVLEPALFRSVDLRDLPDSWTAVVGDPKAKGQLVHAVHGALAVYDLPELRTLLPK